MRIFTTAAIALIICVLFPAFAFAATHVVSRGESLYLISKWYDRPVEVIKLANRITSDNIYPGQRLNIPSQKSVYDLYWVKPGDSLYTIGQKYGVSARSIKIINAFTSDQIQSGQVIKVPYWELPDSWTSNEPAKPQLPPGLVPYTSEDYDLLARLISSEAASEAYQTQVAVGAVVLNRVKSPLFPNTIPGVINQVDQTGRYQFEPVLNGWINYPATASAKKAALEALGGADPTNGALYFFESWVTNRFLRARPVSCVMGSFTFTY